MKTRATLAVLILGGLTLLSGCGDKDTSNAPAPAPTTKATSQPETTTDPESEDTSTPTPEPESEETTKATGSDQEFCATLLDKAQALNPGKDINELTDDQKETMVSTLKDLADSAPAGVKAPLTTMASIYAGVADGKTKITDEAEMKKVAEATMKYTEWTVTHCAPPGS
ncbi:hypothetical protein [Streptomyces sp. SID13031]|uniref:hypothetical protein n=1 Tax=Streptomyces sp. SID13031 TaxID=2706046 RepID=UPI0013C97144|nr:hypothetical protein [Streptomyces sp. SID13031]NEA30363.1 hypothetical protein [Streptomyces sp. SID13031]